MVCDEIFCYKPLKVTKHISTVGVFTGVPGRICIPPPVGLAPVNLQNNNYQLIILAIFANFGHPVPGKIIQNPDPCYVRLVGFWFLTD